MRYILKTFKKEFCKLGSQRLEFLECLILNNIFIIRISEILNAFILCFMCGDYIYVFISKIVILFQ